MLSQSVIKGIVYLFGLASMLVEPQQQIYSSWAQIIHDARLGR